MSCKIINYWSIDLIHNITNYQTHITISNRVTPNNVKHSIRIYLSNIISISQSGRAHIPKVLGFYCQSCKEVEN